MIICCISLSCMIVTEYIWIFDSTWHEMTSSGPWGNCYRHFSLFLQIKWWIKYLRNKSSDYWIMNMIVSCSLHSFYCSDCISNVLCFAQQVWIEMFFNLYFTVWKTCCVMFQLICFIHTEITVYVFVKFLFFCILWSNYWCPISASCCEPRA